MSALSDPANALTAAAVQLANRFQQLGNVSDLEQAIGFARRALALHPLGHPSRAGSLSNLATALFLRFQQFNDLDNLDEAISLHKEAFELRGPGHPERLESLHFYTIAVFARYQQQGDSKDLEDVIELRRETLELCPIGHPHRVTALTNLGNVLSQRFQQQASIDDIQEIVRLNRESVELRPAGDPQRFLSLNNLSNSLNLRFKETGDVDDIEDAIRLQREALSLCPKWHPQYSMTLVNVATVLLVRIDSAVGEHIDDLDEAVKRSTEALALRPVGHPRRFHTLGTLAAALNTRYKFEGSTDDLSQVILLHEEALALLGDTHPDRPVSLNNAGEAYMTRFERLGDQDEKDLEEAIKLHTSALSLRPLGHPLRHTSLWNLSRGYQGYFRSSGDISKSEEALNLMLEALDCLGAGHASRALCLIKLSNVYLLQGAPYYSIPLALKYAREALLEKGISAKAQLFDVVCILGVVTAGGPLDPELLPQLLDLYALVIKILPRVAYFGLGTAARLQSLKIAEACALDGAACALALSRPEAALELLEQGRGIFWTQALRLRTPLDALPVGLRDELRDLAQRLETDSFASGIHASAKSAMEEEIAHRRRQSERFEGLVDEARKLPGFERFMLPPEFSQLAEAASKGPVVVLVASSGSCAAIVVKVTREVLQIPLSVTDDQLHLLGQNLTSGNLESRKALPEDGGRAMQIYVPASSRTSDVLADLWELIAKPVLTALELPISEGRERPRIWWCPTGQFAFLPIHAAGKYVERGDNCSDYVVSSYTPTLDTLLNARRGSTPIPCDRARILLAAVPYSCYGTRLAHAAEEVQNIKGIFPSDSLLELPPADDCSKDPRAGVTVETVLRLLPEASFLHLASHGLQDSNNPLDSGFILRDGVLSIARLMPTPLPHAFLAFLSACETAKGDKDQPDQAVHLAATMLFAGFKSVVATMWSMGDVDGPLVATKVYEQLLAGDGQILDPEIVSYALDDAVRTLRANGLHASRWATYIHLGT